VSQENVEDYRRGIVAWNSGDLDAWLATLPPNWEFRASGVFPGTQPVYRGPDGARQLCQDMRGPWQEFNVSVERIEDLGDDVLALITFEVIGRDGLATSRRWAHVARYDYRGEPIRTENYESWAQALKAVGLEE